MRTLSFVALLLVAFTVVSCDRGRKDTVSGTIETDEVRVGSRYGGRVEKIFAWEGDGLTNGQLIATLDAAELRAQRDHAAAQLDELVAGPRKEEIATAKAQWESQAADLEYAKAEARRAEELFANKTMSAADRDQAVSHAGVMEKSVAAAKSQYDLTLAGTRVEQIAQARAQLAQFDAQLAEMTIAAPGNTVLEVLNVKVGDVLAPNQEVATLLLTNQIWMRVYVPEPWLGHIALADKVTVRVDAFPEKDFNGVVQQIARDAEFTPRNVQTVGERVKQVFGIKVKLDNSDGKLRAGMAADVRFPNVVK